MACGSLFHQSRISETSNILPDSLCFLVILRSPGGRRGEHPGTEWLPTAKRVCGAANAKIKGRSTHMKAKKGGGQLQTKKQIRELTCKMCLFSLYCMKYIFIT